MNAKSINRYITQNINDVLKKESSNKLYHNADGKAVSILSAAIVVLVISIMTSIYFNFYVDASIILLLVLLPISALIIFFFDYRREKLYESCANIAIDTSDWSEEKISTITSMLRISSDISKHYTFDENTPINFYDLLSLKRTLEGYHEDKIWHHFGQLPVVG